MQHGKSIARFISYALCAADEALRDANWIPSEQEDKENTVNAYIIYTMYFSFCCFYIFLTWKNQGVSIGGGIGSIGDILDASQLICEKVIFLCNFFTF